MFSFHFSFTRLHSTFSYIQRRTLTLGSKRENISNVERIALVVEVLLSLFDSLTLSLFSVEEVKTFGLSNMRTDKG